MAAGRASLAERFAASALLERVILRSIGHERC